MERQHLPRQGHSETEMPGLGGAGGGKAFSQQRPWLQGRARIRRGAEGSGQALVLSGLDGCLPLEEPLGRTVQWNFL